MSIMVTGAGMVASQVASKLVERGEHTVLYDLNPRLDYLETILDIDQIEIVSGDILDMARLVEIVRLHNIKQIIHTAGWLTESQFMLSRPYYMLRIKLLGTATVLEAARIMGIERVILSSSGAVYISSLGTNESGAFEEDFPTKAIPPITQAPAALYALTKIAGEHLGLIYEKSYGIEFAALRYSSVFGPLRGQAAGTAGRLINRLVRGGVFGNQVILDSTVASGGELIYSRDAATANVLACFSQKLDKKIYNISMVKTYDFQDIVEVAKKVFPHSKIELKDIPEVSPRFPAKGSSFDISCAQKELGFKPLNLEEAMQDFANWVRLHESPN
jgi:nucleoside-diphosphate-sugar epimerase